MRAIGSMKEGKATGHCSALQRFEGGHDGRGTHLHRFAGILMIALVWVQLQCKLPVPTKGCGAARQFLSVCTLHAGLQAMESRRATRVTHFLSISRLLTVLSERAPASFGMPIAEYGE